MTDTDNITYLINRYKTILPHYYPNPYTSKQQREKEIREKIKELEIIIKHDTKITKAI